MRYLLDTHVLRELRRPKPDRKVVAWLQRNEPACAISDLMIGEFTKGAYFLAEGKRREALLTWIDEVEEQFEDKIIQLDRNAMKHWGELCGTSQREHGRRLQVFDSLIAALALANRLIVVTRNTGNFPNCVSTFSPWEDI
jgi:predicted nucleic acid-binding protein